MPLQDKHLTILWPVFAGLIAISFWFGVKAGGEGLLKNRHAAPSGIGSLERAGSVAEARKVIGSWDHKAPERRTQSEIQDQNFLAALLSNEGRQLTTVARRSLAFDLLFILFYTSAMAVACLLASTEIAIRRHQQESDLVAFGIRLGYLQILTASVDALENLALWRMLSDSLSAFWPYLAYACSIVKYVLLTVSLVYILLAFIFWVVDHSKHPASKPSATAA